MGHGENLILILLAEHSNLLTPNNISLYIDQTLTQPSSEKFLFAVDGN